MPEETSYIEGSSIVKSLSKDDLIPVLNGTVEGSSVFNAEKKYIRASDAVATSGKSTITPTVTSGSGGSTDFTLIFQRIGNNVSVNFFVRTFIIADTELATTLTLDLTGTGFEPSSDFTSGFQVYGAVTPFVFSSGNGDIQELDISTISSSKNVQISVNLQSAASGNYTTSVGGSFSFEVVPV